MNVLNGIITEIRSHEGISLVKIKSAESYFTSIVLDTTETANYLKVSEAIKVIFKETEVIISKDLNPKISLQNRIICSIESIKKGVLLSQINLVANEIRFKSIVTINACEELNLKENDTVLALIKTNEISLMSYD